MDIIEIVYSKCYIIIIYRGADQLDIEDVISDKISILQSNMERISLSRTEKGVLAKWTFILKENIYYVKTGRIEYGIFSNLEPTSEVIAARVGKIIGANVLSTYWDLFNMNKTDEYDEQAVIVSYTKNFLNDGEIYKPIAKYLSLNELNNNDLYNILRVRFEEYRNEIDNMIVFDFLINNTDRHLNNFGFICDENENILRFSPLFDNGCSLFNDIIIDERFTNKFDIADRKSKSKPFRTNQYKQIKLVRSANLNIYAKINIKEICEDLLSKGYITLPRIDIIQKLIERRLEYVRNLLCEK